MYMFQPIATIIRFSFESVVVALIGLVWLYHDGEISTSSVMFAIVKGHGGVSVMCVILGCIAQVFCLLLSYVGLRLFSISSVYCWWAFAVGSVDTRNGK